MPPSPPAHDTPTKASPRLAGQRWRNPRRRCNRAPRPIAPAPPPEPCTGLPEDFSTWGWHVIRPARKHREIHSCLRHKFGGASVELRRARPIPCSAERRLPALRRQHRLQHAHRRFKPVRPLLRLEADRRRRHARQPRGFGPNCIAIDAVVLILQGKLGAGDKVEEAGLTAQLRAPKPAAMETAA